MRIITLNVNGIRSAERKGFARWLARIEPWDVVPDIITGMSMQRCSVSSAIAYNAALAS